MTMSVRTFTRLGAGFAMTVVLAQGCRFTDQNTRHCNNNDGDDYCNREFGDGLTVLYCESGTEECRTPTGQYGCVEQRPADACYSPCGGRSTIDENGECVVVEDSSSGSSGGTDTEESTGSSESSTTGPMPCVGNEDCPDAAAPFCEPVSGECVSCNGMDDPNGACAELDPLYPVCEGMACVQCTEAAPEACTGTTPVCDDASNTCVPCTAHDECGAAACNLFTGACLPANAVVHVGAGQMYTTLTAAVSSFAEEGAEGTIIVHAAMPDYNEVVTVDGGRVLALLAADDVVAPPRWAVVAGGSPQLTVTDATVLLDGLQLSGNANDVGLVVDGGRAWVDRSRIVDNNGGGIVAENGAELTLRNCFVGGSVNNVPALAINGATAAIVYVTSGAGFGTATALSCDPAATVIARNSLFVAEDAAGEEVQCPNATIVHSAAELDLGGTNTALGPMNTNWFAGYGTGDFSLSAMHPGGIATAAQWNDGDPTTDIDGDLRPTVDGTADYAGADVP
jgi:hypothetical protein